MTDPNPPAPPQGTPPPATPPVPAPTPRDPVAVGVACVALTCFGIFLIILSYKLDLPETQWARATYLLNGVEAVALAAAGYIFGREVHRGQAQSAEVRAQREQQRAEENQKDAVSGKILAKEVKRRAQGPTRVTFETEAVDTRSDTKPGDLEDLAQMASELFPET
jgi:hypothetical protein